MESLLQVVLLGIIEGITEFLPISSTGHLLIAQHWLGRRSDLFNVAIQAGAILAVVVIYRQRLWDLAVHFSRAENRSYVYRLTAAVAITVVGGFVAKQMGLELPDTVAPVAWALILGGFAIFAIEAYARRQPPSDAADVEGRFLGRHRPDPGGRVPGNLTLRGDDLRGDARRHDVAAGGGGILVPGRHPDDVRSHRLRGL